MFVLGNGRQRKIISKSSSGLTKGMTFVLLVLEWLLAHSIWFWIRTALIMGKSFIYFSMHSDFCTKTTTQSKKIIYRDSKKDAENMHTILSIQIFPNSIYKCSILSFLVTPARSLSISGLKSQVLQLPFLT